MESSKQETKSKPSNKTNLWIGLGVGAFALVVGIVAAIVLIPQMMRPDYHKMNDAVVELEEELDHYFYNSACVDVETYVDDKYVSIDEYNEFLKECKNDAENIYTHVAKFESESSVTKDNEINDLYAKFMVAFNKKAPSKDQLESTLKVYEAVHSFLVAADELDFGPDSLPTPTEFAKVTDYLINSNNEVLKNFAEGLNQHYDALYEAGQAFLSANPDDDNYMDLYEAYSDASDDFSDYYDEQSEIINELEVFLADTSDDEPSVNDSFEEMKSAIVEKAR